MGGFFKGWRRKLGVVTLLIACMVTAEWVRSFEFSDCVWVTDVIYQRDLILESINGRIRWYCQDPNPAFTGEPSPPYFFCFVLARRSEEPDLFTSAAQSVADFCWGPEWFKFGGGDFLSIEPIPSHDGLQLSIPHWSIVIPLTLISARLLLSKPRKSIAGKIPPNI